MISTGGGSTEHFVPLTAVCFERWWRASAFLLHRLKFFVATELQNTFLLPQPKNRRAVHNH
jgi:hypothetical protein